MYIMEIILQDYTRILFSLANSKDDIKTWIKQHQCRQIDRIYFSITAILDTKLNKLKEGNKVCACLYLDKNSFISQDCTIYTKDVISFRREDVELSDIRIKNRIINGKKLFRHNIVIFGRFSEKPLASKIVGISSGKYIGRSKYLFHVL